MNRIKKYGTIMLFASLLSSAFAQVGQRDMNQAVEKYRPIFHFTPKQGWMNDPNGMVYLNGNYHLFFQHNPEKSVWGPMHWGHAISKDLIHWDEQKIALYPDSLGTIFSGSAVIDKNNTAGFGTGAMVAIFTHHNHQEEDRKTGLHENQSLAYSLDQGVTWTKYKGNPVLPNPGIWDFRDPKV
ncbi:MAG: glycoside hydrolase family 32 protein, partial [Sphingobacterium sp.]